MPRSETRRLQQYLYAKEKLDAGDHVPVSVRLKLEEDRDACVDLSHRFPHLTKGATLRLIVMHAVDAFKGRTSRWPAKRETPRLWKPDSRKVITMYTMLKKEDEVEGYRDLMKERGLGPNALALVLFRDAVKALIR